MILQLDRFGQLVQTVPAMIPKLRFKNPNVTEAMGDTQEVVICNETAHLSTTDPDSGAMYWIGSYSHLSCQIGNRVYEHVANWKPQPAFFALDILPLHRNFWLRYHRENKQPLRWFMRWSMVPYFVGLPDDKVSEGWTIPDAFALTMWLEDYADSVFDPIKAEQFAVGVRLLQTYLTPPVLNEKK